MEQHEHKHDFYVIFYVIFHTPESLFKSKWVVMISKITSSPQAKLTRLFSTRTNRCGGEHMAPKILWCTRSQSHRWPTSMCVHVMKHTWIFKNHLTVPPHSAQTSIWHTYGSFRWESWRWTETCTQLDLKTSALLKEQRESGQTKVFLTCDKKIPASHRKAGQRQEERKGERRNTC